MKKTAGLLLAALAALASLDAPGIGATRSMSRPNARIVIPIQRQPEFTGGLIEAITTNTVFNLTGWTTNTASFTTVSNGLVSVTNIAPTFAAFDLIATNTIAEVNTNIFPFADFVVWAVDEAAGEVVYATTSRHN